LKNDTQFVASAVVFFFGGGEGWKRGIWRVGDSIGGYRILVGQLREGDDLEKHRRRWECNIQLILDRFGGRGLICLGTGGSGGLL
jgi:hypothetical protein